LATARDGVPQKKLVMFACLQRLAETPRSLEQTAARSGYGLRVVPMPCSSALEPAIVLRAFEAGADAVALLACLPEYCRLGDGSARASRRMARASRMLTEAGVGAGRILFLDGEPGRGDTEGLDQLIEAAQKAGPNPLTSKP
jgi:coenzyme F420-reducing hydrogenase delta subunit